MSIATIEQFRATQAFLRSQEEGLADLRAKLLPRFPDRLALLGRAYVDEIRQLRATLDAFLDMEAEGIRTADVVVDLKGVRLGDAPISALTSTIDGIRRGILTLAGAIRRGKERGEERESGGRLPREVEKACDFQLLALAPGSVRFGLRLPSATQLSIVPLQELGGRASRVFLGVAEWASALPVAVGPDGPDLPEPATLAKHLLGLEKEQGVERRLRPSFVAWQVLKALPGQDSPVTGIALGGALLGQRQIMLTQVSRTRLREAVLEGEQRTRSEAQGEIHSLDLDAGTFSLRKRPGGEPKLRCLFEPIRHERDVLRAAGKAVRVIGTLVRDPIKGTARYLLVDEIEISKAK